MIYKETQGSLIKSTFVLNSALRDNEINQLPMVLHDGFGRKRERPVSWLAGAISVLPGETELMLVTMSGRNKEHTMVILDKVLQKYEAEIVNKERIEKVETLTKLRSRNRLLFEAIKKKTDEISNLARELGATDNRVIQQEQQLKIGQLNQAQREVELQRRRLIDAQDKFRLLIVESQLGTGTPSEYRIQDELEKDARYYQIGLRIDQYKDEVEQMSGFVRPNSAQLQELQQEIARLERKRLTLASEMRPRVVARIKSESGISPADLQRELALQRQQIINYQGQVRIGMAVYQEKLTELGKYGGSSGDLAARSNDLTALHRDMAAIRGDMRVLEIELDGPKRVTVIQPANVPRDSNWMSRIIQVAGGWMLCMCGVIAATAYWDYLSKKVNGEEDLTRSARVIGTLPAIQRGLFGGRGPIEEAMRVSIDGIRTAILYNRDHATQCVMVTSATGQEGRSTVASQLAVSMARAGKTTLLVDADLRNPQQHAVFGIQPHGGLSEMLRGEQTSDQAIAATSVENVWLLSAGRCDQTALQGLASDHGKGIFQDFRDRFDVIIIDASPVLTSPDALLIGLYADSAVLSVRRDVSQLPKVNAAADRLASVGIPVLGAVVNGSNVELRSGEQSITAPVATEEQPALTNA
jgi:capsular exopolysaccharide synthesis family protein